MRGRAAKGDVSGLRPLAPDRCSRPHACGIRPGGRGAVRRAHVRAAADALCRELWHRPGVQFRAGGGGRAGAQGLVRCEGRRRQCVARGEVFRHAARRAAASAA
ncbi:hypothetical protein G6F62_015456 [Rhizopus arrhizus]|nr:hypothetical protein G6F62_015456 [Rhizopus arrhizus]